MTTTHLKTRGNVSVWLGYLVLATLIPLPVYADDYADVSRLLDTQRFKDALVKADRYLISRPDDAQMRFLRGVALSDSGRTAEAISAFSDITADYPELPEPYNNLAVLYAAQNQLDKARASLELSVKANPAYVTAQENLGDIYARLASQAYDRALKLDANNAGLQPKLAVVRKMQVADSSGRAAGSAAAFAAIAAGAPTKAAPSAPSASSPIPTNPSLKPQSSGVARSEIDPSTSSSSPESRSAAATLQARVDAAVRQWAAAWSQKDLETYFKAYSDDFVGPGKQSRQIWESERHKRIMGKQTIEVQLSDLVITISGNKAKVKFRQNYNADTLQINSAKTLDMVLIGDRWLIRREKDSS